MKIKQQLYITYPDRFLRGDYDSCFALFGDATAMPKDWIHCGEITIDVDVDTSEMTQALSAAIDAEAGELNDMLAVLERRKNNLTHDKAA